MAITCPPTAPVDTDKFIADLLNDLDYATLNFLCENDGLSSYVVTMWRAGAILVVLYIGFTFLFGGSATVKDLLAQLAKVVFVLIVVTFAGTYNSIFYTLSNVFPNELAAQLINIDGNASVARCASPPCYTNGGGGVNAALNDYLDQGMTLSGQVLEDAGWWKGFLDRLFSGIVALVTIIFTFAAMLLLTLSKLATAVILSVGPFFLIGLMFDKTKGYFEAWFKALMSFALIPLILYALMALILSIMQTYYNVAESSDLGSSGAFIEFLAPVIVISLIGIALITQVQGIAAQLAGGVAMNTQAGLAWAGRQIQDSAGKGVRQAARKGGAKAKAGAGAIARSPMNFARGMKSEQHLRIGDGRKPTAFQNFSQGVKNQARKLREGVSRTRRDGVAYSAGRATTKSVQAANLRSMKRRAGKQ